LYKKIYKIGDYFFGAPSIHRVQNSVVPATLLSLSFLQPDTILTKLLCLSIHSQIAFKLAFLAYSRL